MGKQVRLRADRRGTRPRGTIGSVYRCYGEPEYLALEVVLEDGRSHLFWSHDGEEDGAR